eukprot:GDKK01004690.1.p1 GENE.GDKK01004690.1~~GDKK01004690.1.p1  ORF type:complete len:307 (+),score=59.81 GDKK01004690.1:39-923(+)
MDFSMAAPLVRTNEKSPNEKTANKKNSSPERPLRPTSSSSNNAFHKFVQSNARMNQTQNLQHSSFHSGTTINVRRSSPTHKVQQNQQILNETAASQLEKKNRKAEPLTFKEIDLLSSSIDSRWGSTDRFATELLMRTAASAAKLKSLLDEEASLYGDCDSPVRRTLQSQHGLSGPLGMIANGVDVSELLCKIRWFRFDSACKSANISTQACIIDPVKTLKNDASASSNVESSEIVNSETFPEAHLNMLKDLKRLVTALSAGHTDGYNVSGSPSRSNSPVNKLLLTPSKNGSPHR